MEWPKSIIIFYYLSWVEIKYILNFTPNLVRNKSTCALRRVFFIFTEAKRTFNIIKTINWGRLSSIFLWLYANLCLKNCHWSDFERSINYYVWCTHTHKLNLRITLFDKRQKHNCSKKMTWIQAAHACVCATHIYLSQIVCVFVCVWIFKWNTNPIIIVDILALLYVKC